MTVSTFAEALPILPPHVRSVAERLVVAAGGREPRIDEPDDEHRTGWLLSWSTTTVYVDVEVAGDGPRWFVHIPGPVSTSDGGDLPADSIPEPLATALRSLA